MKKIYLILATIAGVVLTSCSSDDLIDTSPVNNVEGESPIVFGSLSKGFTRADFFGRDAAAKLNNMFVVSAKKGSTTASTTGKIVFDNYLVEYEENTAQTTESNATNWEYVGKGPITHASNKGITSQTIKFWDYTAPQYDFIAWSTGSKTAIYTGTPNAGQVLVSAIDPNATATGAYTFTGSREDLSQCYISDLMTVKKIDGNYKDPVTLTFRQLGTKVRIGIYETIPGYSVKNVKFYTKGTVLTKDEETSKPKTGQIVDDATIFSSGTDVYLNGTYTVTFPTVDNTSSADNNQAHVAFTGSGDQTSIVQWGELNYKGTEGSEKNGTKYLGRSSNDASYAGNAATNYYKVFLPNESGMNLNLRVDYTLEATDGGGEEIEVKNARALVPSIYAQWKPGFAYTYLFKISDKTNGRTGVYDPTQSDDAEINSDPAGLYPITFDAVVVNAEDNEQTQENITLVSTPSITTYQQYSTVVDDNEYDVNGKDIFVTVNEGDDLVTLTGVAALYTIPNGKTEAEVVDALQIQDDYPDAGTIKGRNGMVLTEATPVATVADITTAGNYTLTNSVQFGADGNAISVDADQALRFMPAANTTYAFVYTKTASTTTTDKFEVVTKTAGTDVTHLYRNFNLTAGTGDAQSGKVYMSMSEEGVLTQQSTFVGQYVTGLYERTGGTGTTEDPYKYTVFAGGFSASGATYYIKNGADYIKAVNIPYADFAGATDLYTKEGTSYTEKTGSSPVSTKSYYKRTGTGGDGDPYVYTYCVILPQQVDGLYEYQFDADGRYACFDNEKALAGHGYFDKYTQNNGEYYTKVIKVQ